MSDVYIPAGFHFRPTEKELIEGYLKRKVLGQPLPSSCVIERDLYSAAPWDVFTDRDPWETIETENSSTGRTKTEHVIYVLTRLKMASKKRVSRIAGCGTWNGQTRTTQVKNKKKEVIGFKKMLNFEIKGGEKVDDRVEKGHWIMYEYSLAGNQEEEEGSHVLCQIKRDDSKSLKRARNTVNDQSYDEEQNSDQKRVKNEANTQLMDPYIESRMGYLPIVQNIESQDTTGFTDGTKAISQLENQTENLPGFAENAESDYGACLEDASSDNLMMNPCSGNQMENLPVVQNQLENSTGSFDATAAIWQLQNQRENPPLSENIESSDGFEVASSDGGGSIYCYGRESVCLNN